MRKLLPWVELALPPIYPTNDSDKFVQILPSDVLMEVKLDGYRGLTYFRKGKGVRFVSKNRHPLYGFNSLADQLAEIIPAENAIIDGEIVSVDDRFCSNLLNVRNRVPPFQLAAFDLVWLNGVDLRKEQLRKRNALLLELVPKGTVLQYVPPLEGDPEELFKLLVSKGHEGMVVKDLSSQYIEGPEAGRWYKMKRKYTKDELAERQRWFSKRKGS